MKNLILIFTAVLSSCPIYAQCTARAGEDMHRCSPDSVVILGGNPSAINGQSPYTYEWWIDPIPTGSQVVPYLYASNMLNDTSIANPSFTYTGNFLDSSITFFLRITDATGCQSLDTIAVTTSIFNVHLIYHEYWINQGDSVFLNQIPNISGGFGTSMYDWNPSYGLSDTSLAVGFWASPDTSSAYAATVTDSKGCAQTGSILYYVYVLPLGIDNIFKSKINIFPNPTFGHIYIEADPTLSIDKYELCNSVGQSLMEMDGSQKSINMTPFPNGIYLLKVHFDTSVLTYRMVKK